MRSSIESNPQLSADEEEQWREGTQQTIKDLQLNVAMVQRDAERIAAWASQCSERNKDELQTLHSQAKDLVRRCQEVGTSADLLRIGLANLRVRKEFIEFPGLVGKSS